MAIEIREIEIKASVSDGEQNSKNHQHADITEEIIQEVVERVLEILKNRKGI